MSKCSGDSRIVAPLPRWGWSATQLHCHVAVTRTLPCCGCACSATRLLGCHPSRCSPPLFHSHVRVNSVLAARTACRLRRVSLVCARGRGWATHGLLTEVSTGVPWVSCRDPPVCSRCPGSMASVAERQLVLCWSVCCGARTRSVEHAVSTFCTVFSHTPPRHGHDLWPCRSWEKLRTTCGSPLADTTVLLVSPHCTRCTADWNGLRIVRSLLELASGSGCRFALLLRWRLWLQPARCIFYVLQSFSTHVSLMTHGSSDRPTVDRSPFGIPTQLVLPSRVWLAIVRTCFIHFTRHWESSWCTRFSRFVAHLVTARTLGSLTNQILELLRLDEIRVPYQVFLSIQFSSWTTCCNSHDFPGQWFCVCMDLTACCVWLIHQVFFLNWCNTSPDWFHCCFFYAVTEVHHWWLATPCDVPELPLEIHTHDLHRTTCVDASSSISPSRFAWSLRSTYSAFQDLLKSFCT